MSHFLLNIASLSILTAFGNISQVSGTDHADKAETVYNFSFSTADGEDLELSNFRGQVLLIVNTASECGFTKQYEGLQQLYEKYQDQGFIIIAVPSNDFGKQEPGNDIQIQKFCQINFGVTFPVVQKQIVKGSKAHPFYLWAKKKLGFTTAPKWNFHKYLIDREGHLVDYFYSTTSPTSSKLVKAIENLLDKNTSSI